tara:strand:+ start:213 stop:455 length:243 start_codon:yes stop_codon:yes gene_type:complete
VVDGVAVGLAIVGFVVVAGVDTGAGAPGVTDGVLGAVVLVVGVAPKENPPPVAVADAAVGVVFAVVPVVGTGLLFVSMFP